MSPAPVTLTGRTIRLEPLSPSHVPALATIAADAEIFKWFPVSLASPAAIAKWMNEALAAQAARTALPFATVLLEGNRVIGSTRFMNISEFDGRYEIGGTWLAESLQRTAANSEAKYLMLRHAFETLGARRVELKTHVKNAKSRRAIERLGAVFEGTHRNHMRMPDGTMRDSVWYSITDAEWPAAKARLETWLAPRA